jgi:hypothetical protein
MAESSKPTRRKRQQTKDRVLQARIPEQLDEELRDRAEQLGLSVSTIVRNVLLNTFDLYSASTDWQGYSQPCPRYGRHSDRLAGIDTQ